MVQNPDEMKPEDFIEKYRLLADNINDSVWVMDNNLQLTYMSPSIERLSGYTVQEMMVMPLEQVYTSESLETMIKAYQEEASIGKTLAEGESTSRMLELQTRNKDGSTDWIEVSLTVLRDKSKEITEIVGVTRKITERKRAEELLHKSKQLFEKVFTSQLDALFILDASDPTVIIECNPRASEIFGYTRGEMLGKDTGFLHASQEDLQRFQRILFPAVAESGFVHIPDFRMRRKDGTVFPSEHSVVELRDENEQRTGWISVVRDITERKTAEDSMKVFYNTEKELRKSLEDEMKRRVNFTRALVHELKTPVTAMMASSQLLAEEAPEGPLLRLAKNIEESVIRLNKRISELLDIARGELGILKLNRKRIDLPGMFQDIEMEMSIAISNNKQSLIVEPPPNIPFVMGDEERLREVIINLIGNAIKYTPQGGKITLRARESNNSLIVEVEDTGSGIDKKDIERIFEPYYRAENRQVAPTGLGLGLAICKRTIELHGGKIWVSSQKGKGSTFGFSIPLTTAAT